MKKILITQRITDQNEKSDAQASLDLTWISFFQNLDCLPIPVLATGFLNDLVNEINPAGIVLSGGNDLNCVNQSIANQYRDSVNELAIKIAINKSLPLIGVCRGAQFLGKYFGLGITSNLHAESREHKIIWNKQLILPNCKVENPEIVNSYHNFSLAGESPVIEILATADDKSIEAFMHREHNFLGIAWHPERYVKSRNFDLELFELIFGL